ncbi:protein Jade-1 isoform X7 [Poeciliopsis prolifica]|uniref:protein Jade-1 isoform X7 n=1 Tax=Poeciliopsis prolifica TaxID=188132 RepID=UPI0024145F40|nr:protein Jade-1 isoform X7 [Poeciliopsis prolifica]
MRSCSPCWVTSSPGAAALCLCMWNAGQAELKAKTALHIKLKHRLASLGRVLVLMPELHRQKTMKRSRHPSSSDDSDNGRCKKRKRNRVKKRTRVKTKRRNNVRMRRRRQTRTRVWTFKDILTGNSTCWSQHSSQHRRGTGQKPSEVFRTDFITAMKLHDSYQLNPEDYYVLADPWRQEWEKGVQVPVSPQSIPQPVTSIYYIMGVRRVLAEKGKEVMFIRPKKLIRTSGTEALGYVDIRTLAEGMCRYDLNEEDVAWLQIINEEFAQMAMPPLDENTMERVMEEFEHCCHENMTHAMETEEGLGIEYDEDVVCDVCQSPDGEDNNEMVFCDKCNICVHQACYGIQKVPKGSWLCRICALGIFPKCQVCPKKGGAMKPTRSGTKWVHVSCALWIPEVSIGNPEKMEPITNVSHIPSNRWALICCLCKEKTGACIQVRNLTYMVTRREKMKRSLWKVQEQIFQHQVRLLDHELLNGEPSAEDLERLFSLGSFSSDGGQSGSSWSNSGLKSKRSSLKQERRKSLSDSPSVHRKDGACSPLDIKDSKSSHIQEAAATESKGEAKVLQLEVSKEKPFLKLQKVIQEHASVKLHKPESRKGPRRETPGPEYEVPGCHKQDPEPEERGRKRRSDVSESFPCQLKNKFGSKHLDKTVSIRLVDIRNSDSDEYLFDDAATRRSVASPDATPNTKFKPSSVSDASKASSWLRKAAAGGSHAPNGSASGHLKGWGKFRIPKRADKPPSATAREREELEPSDPLLRPLTNAPAYPRTRLRSGPEADGYNSDSKPADGELEPCLKRCHSHELRGDSSLGRRYGSDIIRRGVLAS